MRYLLAGQTKALNKLALAMVDLSTTFSELAESTRAMREAVDAND